MAGTSIFAPFRRWRRYSAHRTGAPRRGTASGRKTGKDSRRRAAPIFPAGTGHGSGPRRGPGRRRGKVRQAGLPPPNPLCTFCGGHRHSPERLEFRGGMWHITRRFRSWERCSRQKMHRSSLREWCSRQEARHPRPWERCSGQKMRRLRSWERCSGQETRPSSLRKRYSGQKIHRSRPWERCSRQEIHRTRLWERCSRGEVHGPGLWKQYSEGKTRRPKSWERCSRRETCCLRP